MSALIGTRFVYMSSMGRFLDSTSIVKIAEHAIGKKFAPVSIPVPKMPNDSGKYPPPIFARSVAAYEKRVVDSEKRRAWSVAQDAEFNAARFVVATTKTGFAGEMTSERVMLEVRTQEGEEMLADITTGCLFDTSGRCLSTEQIRIISTRDCTLSERKKIVASKRTRGSSED